MKHFAIEIFYTAPLTEIEKTTIEHRQFLMTGYENGIILFSGPKVPRTGGFVVARSESLELLQKFFSNDPYLKKNLAEYRFTEFFPANNQSILKEWFGK